MWLDKPSVVKDGNPFNSRTRILGGYAWNVQLYRLKLATVVWCKLVCAKRGNGGGGNLLSYGAD